MIAAVREDQLHKLPLLCFLPRDKKPVQQRFDPRGVRLYEVEENPQVKVPTTYVCITAHRAFVFVLPAQQPQLNSVVAIKKYPVPTVSK